MELISTTIIDIPSKTPRNIPIINENNINAPSNFDIYLTVFKILYSTGDGLLVVYIDVLIFTNIIINYCILSLTKKFLHLKSSETRIILSAFIGSIFSLTVLINSLNNILSLLIKIICITAMCLIAFKAKQIIVILKSVCATFIFTVLFCGVILLIHNFTRADTIAIINDTIYFQIDSVKLIIISVVIYTIIMLIQRIIKSDFNNTIANLKFTIQGIEYSCYGKIDTGCTVTEPFSGAPVIIVEKGVITNSIIPSRIIPYKALGSEGILDGIKAEKVVIDKRLVEKDVYIAIYKGCIDPQFKAIINHNLTR